MALNKLGTYIEPINRRNTQEEYTENDVCGISTSKCFIKTKADLDGVKLSNYKVVKKHEFAYVPDTSRRGEKIGLAYASQKDCIVSSIYTVFRIKKDAPMLPDYLFMYFNRPEFDRYTRFNSWGSAREVFTWQEMCDIDIDVPDLPTQEKYVKTYLAMLENQKAYETGLEDLKLVCDGYIEDLRRNMPCEEIGKYIEEVNTRNTLLKVSLVQGVENTSRFIETKANINGLDFSNYKIVNENYFAYNPSRINIGSIALKLRNSNVCIVSPMYTVFKVINEKELLSEYLMLWLSRLEFFRSTLFYAMGSVRDIFSFSCMKEVKIPIPDIKIQKSIVAIYNAYIMRKEINEKLKAQIKDLCPILIKGSLEEAKK